eukprot:1422276-Ditylum_brightwellii.AAC.1
MSAGVAPCLWCTQIQGITVDMQDHVAGMVSQDSIRVGGCIIQELRDCFCGLAGGVFLLGCNGI